MSNENVSGTRKEYDSHHRLTKRARGAAVPIFDIEARVPAARPSPLHYLCMCRPTVPLCSDAIRVLFNVRIVLHFHSSDS